MFLYLPQHYPKKHAVPERNQVSKGSNSNCILNTSCSSNSRNTTNKRSHENSIGTVYSISTSINIEDLNTRIGAEAISVGRHCSKETSDGYIEGEEVGSSPPASPGAGLQKDPVKLNEKGGVQSSSRTSHANSPNTSSFISSYFCSTLGQLPAHFSTNGKSKNIIAMRCDGHVGYFPPVFLSYALVEVSCVIQSHRVRLYLLGAPDIGCLEFIGVA